MPTEQEALAKFMKSRPDLAKFLGKWFDDKKAVINRNSKMTIDDLTKEELVIVASPFHCDIDGSKQAKCACGTLVWLSPSTQEVITRRGAAPMRIICGQCFIEMTKNEQC